MNAATVNVRLAALVFAVGLFAAVWTGDRRHRQALAKADPLPTGQLTANFSSLSPEIPSGGLVYVGDSPWTVGFDQPFLPRRPRAWNRPENPIPSAWPVSATAPTGEELDVLACEIPFPEELMPGEYRIVGSHGAVHAVTLSAADLGRFGVRLARRSEDVRTTGDGARRWHFIRVDDPAIDEVAAQPVGCCPGSIELIQWIGGRAPRDLQMAGWRCNECWTRANRRLAAVHRLAVRSRELAAGKLADAWSAFTRAGRIAVESDAKPRF